MKSVETVLKFWHEVWNARDLDAVDDFVADDVVLASGRQERAGKEYLKNWIKEFFDKVNELEVDAGETFQNEEGTRVTSRWVLTGTNNGILGTKRRGQPIAMTGTAIWAVGEDGKLVRNWVELASWEQYQRLLAN